MKQHEKSAANHADGPGVGAAGISGGINQQNESGGNRVEIVAAA